MESVSHNLNLLTFTIKHILHIKKLVKLCCDVNYTWWGNQYLEMKEWEDCIKSWKSIILAFIVSVPNKNSTGCK